MITTHVLDTSRGKPAAGVPVVLEAADGGAWSIIGSGETDADGRLRSLVSGTVDAGTYRLTFETKAYFDALSVRAFYPRVIVVFDVAEGETHYHVPLLLSPFGYTTYRGS